MRHRYWVILVLTVMGLIWWRLPIILRDNEDFRLAIIGSNGMTLRSVSPQRRMINDLSVERGVSVWIPGGLGWYQSDKLGKVLTQEKKQNKAGEIMFYNFGFIPDVILFTEGDDWLYRGDVIKKWGIIGYLRYWLSKSSLMIKKDEVKGELKAMSGILEELVPRDLADSRLLKEDLRLTVYNSGQSDGLAAFLSGKLEWSGFTVVGVENFGSSEDNCLIIFGKATGQSYGLAQLKKIFNECKFSQSGELGEKEIELYFGDKFSQMINYQSYVGTF